MNPTDEHHQPEVTTAIGDKHLVSPAALRQCSVKRLGKHLPILDLSYIRIVFEAPELDLVSDEISLLDLELDRLGFSVYVSLGAKGEGWVRCLFEKMPPSAQAHLRSFLSPKRIGESLLEDWRNDELRHFHGLNESEMWIHQNGTILYTYLDSPNGSDQFFVRLIEGKNPLQIGRVSRKDYLEMASLEAPLSLEVIAEKELIQKLGECRDMITNFRPTGQMEYNFKQRLLKSVSDHLYSSKPI